MVLLSIFYTNQIHGGSSADCSLFILSLHALALHLAVKILLNLSVWRFDVNIHLSFVFPSRMPAGPHFVTQPILLIETLQWRHKSSNKTQRRSDRIETIKTIMPNTRPHHMEEVLPMAQVRILKKIFDQVRKRFRLAIVLFWTKTSQRLTLYLLSNTDNIHIVLENDNTVLIKGLKKVVNVNSQETRIL